MGYILTKKTSSAKGILFAISKENGYPIRFFLTKTKTLYGIEKFYANRLVKWVIDSAVYKELVDFEVELLNSINKYIEKEGLEYESIELVSKILSDSRFPTMIQTIVEGKSGEVIKHQSGSLVTFNDIIKGFSGNIQLEVKSINISNGKLYYNIVNKVIEPIE